ncbi:MAG TPA: cytochrome P450 [Candidatus Thermoplasmatota archaeon]|jgi:cytochrome P450|nr:cytochrome P450 [Candidatus Thermoplasmatota archaeon]
MPRYPPGPRAPLLQLGRIYRDPLTSFQGYIREHGNIVHLPFGGLHVFLVNEPEAIQEVLVKQHRSFHKGRALQEARRLLGNGLLTANGDEHLGHRRALLPVFRHERIQGYAAIMAQQSARARDRLRAGEEFDMHDAMMRLTLGIIGQALFDIDLEAEPDFLRALSVSVDNFNRLTAPFAPVVDRLPLPETRRLHAAKRAMDERIFAMIDERRGRVPGERQDLLSWLLEAEDAERGERMSAQQVRDEAVTVLLAGHETTANGLTWTWYLLSQHPEVAAQLRAEVAAVLGDRAPTAEDVPKLKLARQVFAEGMRLYPPAWIIGRKAIEPVRIAGYDLPKGSLVLMSQFMMHRDARFWPEPDSFDPDRWTPEATAARPKFCYFPFGGGPRSCIGEPLAWMEAVVVLATFAQRWRFALARGFEPELEPKLTLRPKHGMRMVAHPA